MDWIQDHLQLVIAAAAAIAYWLNARRKDKAGQAADYDGDGKPDNVPGGARAMREHEQAMEHAENTRRIQEEIRRKIAERQGGGHAVPPPMPPAMPPAPPVLRREQPERARQAMEERRAEAEREAAVVLERQRGLAAQLAALQARKAEAGREAKSVWASQQPEPVATPGRVRDDAGLLAELRNARSLRRAIILREVLGTPVGLR
jgi:hypothetical protein